MQDFSQQTIALANEAKDILQSVQVLKNHLQSQFNKEFDYGSTSDKRGMIYARCGTACQSIIAELDEIVSDLELLDDIKLTVYDENTDIERTVQIF